MPKIRVENVEDEECYNFILLKCPTINKKLKISCCFNDLASFVRFGFFRRGLVFFFMWCLVTLRPPTFLLYSLYESNTTYVRCFEVIYTR